MLTWVKGDECFVSLWLNQPHMIQRDLTHIVPALSESSEFDQFRKQVVYDYWLSVVSRECSVIGRKEVLTGKAKFGIVGDGKEVAQIAMAKAFEKGDWRSGYYRDQTLVMALGICSVRDFLLSCMRMLIMILFLGSSNE